MNSLNYTKQNHHLGFVFGKRYKNLFNEVSSASIVLYRIAFGIIMCYEIYRYFKYNWIARYWINTKYNFTYWPFDFIKPLSGNGMYFLFGFMAILALFIMIGFLYRISTILFFLSFTYMFLLEQSRYLNHFYLIVLLSFVLIFIPANRSFSIDSKLFKGIKSNTIPLWSLWLLRFMVAIPLFYGGIAKINADWLVGQPLEIWLSKDLDFPIIGRFFTEKWMILFMSYAGLILDLLFIPLLLFKRTRVFGFAIGLLFHLMNSKLFSIGIFPWFMMASTTLFFSPDWPIRLINYFRSSKIPSTTKNISIERLAPKQKQTIIALSIWVLLMLLIPLRHFVIPGNVSWTECGHKYAWHMKLRTKRAKGVFIVSALDSSFTKRISTTHILPKWQQKRVLARPPLIWQFANKLQRDYAKKGIDVAVYADIQAKLNGRAYQQFTDASVDLTKVPYPIFLADWILPLKTELK